MYMYKILYFLIAGLLIASCGQQGTGLKTSSVSGYNYKHFVATGAEKPDVGDFVYFNMDLYDDKDSLLISYRGQETLPSVEILDDSNENRKKNPMVDILSLISLGDSVAIIVPKDSIPAMPPGMDDVQHIEYHLVVEEILTADENQARVSAAQQEQLAQMEAMKGRLVEVEALTEQTLKDYKSGRLEVATTANGVKYFIHEKGTGDQASNERMVTMNYYGRTVSDGNRFDDSFSRGRGYSYRVGNDAVIQGWHEIGPVFHEGTKASVFIPAELGYGAQGSPPNIGPGAELYFYMEAEKVFY